MLHFARHFIIAVAIGLAVSWMALVGTVLAATRLLSAVVDADVLTVLDTLISNDYRAIRGLYPQGCPYGLPTEQTPDDTVSCIIRPPTGALRSIEVTLHHRMIEQVIVAADGLRVGDLVRRWGRPDLIEKNGQQYTLHWDNHIYATVSALGRFSYLASVQSIRVFLAV
jgi:hypothetical protein